MLIISVFFNVTKRFHYYRNLLRSVSLGDSGLSHQILDQTCGGNELMV